MKIHDLVLGLLCTSLLQSAEKGSDEFQKDVIYKLSIHHSLFSICSTDSKIIFGGFTGFTGSALMAYNFSNQRREKVGGHYQHINSISRAPISDNTMSIQLASGSNDQTIILWEVAPKSDLVLKKRILVEQPVYSVSYSPARVLAYAAGNKLGIVKNDKCILFDNGHTKKINSVHWACDGSRIASGSDGNTIKIWDPETQQSIRILKGHKEGYFGGAVYSAKWAPQEVNLLASAAWDGTVKLWDARIPECINTLKGHTARVNCIDWSPNGRLLASGSRDDTVKIWELDSGQSYRTAHTLQAKSWVYDVHWITSFSLAVANLWTLDIWKRSGESHVVSNAITIQDSSSGSEPAINIDDSSGHHSLEMSVQERIEENDSDDEKSSKVSSSSSSGSDLSCEIQRSHSSSLLRTDQGESADDQCDVATVVRSLIDRVVTNVESQTDDTLCGQIERYLGPSRLEQSGDIVLDFYSRQQPSEENVRLSKCQRLERCLAQNKHICGLASTLGLLVLGGLSVAAEGGYLS